jgi:GNAT superfamily N-acetyltransferase
VTSAVPPGVLALAEDVNAHLPLGRGRERLVDERFVVWLSDGPGPAYTVVQRLRLAAEDVDATVREVRRLLRRHGRLAASWEIGLSATPANLERRLLALGMRPAEDPDVVGMVLDGAPPPVSGVDVRQASTLEDYERAEELKLAAFGGAATASEVTRRAEQQYADDRETGLAATFLALVDGAPAGQARVILCRPGAVFNAGCVIPAARGRGAYRALVAARVAHARSAGSPAVVTQAGRMSRLILERIGFREVTRVRILVDDGGDEDTGAANRRREPPVSRTPNASLRRETPR